MNFQKVLMPEDAHAIETQRYLENLETQNVITKYELLKHTSEATVGKTP